MPVERQDTGRWMWNAPNDGPTPASVSRATKPAGEVSRAAAREPSRQIETSACRRHRKQCKSRNNACFATPRLFRLQLPPRWSADPLVGKTIDRRAGCGRTARPVRREGRGAQPLFLTPIARRAQKSSRAAVRSTWKRRRLAGILRREVSTVSERKSRQASPSAGGPPASSHREPR